MRVKSYEQAKKEKEAQLNTKRKAINDILTSAKNNPKFAKLLSYSFGSLDKMVTPPQSDVRLNAKLTIEQGGVEVLRSSAIKNISHEDLIIQIAIIILKLIYSDEGVDQELALKFVGAKGHEAVIEILLSKNKGPGSVPLIKCLNYLCQVPKLINTLLNAGLAEAIKLVNDLYTDDIQVISINLDTMKKVSNQKTGREFLIKRGIVPSILQNVKKCSDSLQANAVFNGLIVVDNLCRNDDGKKEVKEADGPIILCDVVENFSESPKIINKSAKIFTKIMTKTDLENELAKLKTCSDRLDKEDVQEIITIGRDALELVSNLMLVDELGRIVCLEINFEMLIALFYKLCKIDLSKKTIIYISYYLMFMKYFMTLFKRAFDYMPEILDKNTEKGKKYVILIVTINNCIKKNWQICKTNVEKLEKDGDKNGELQPLKNSFNSFFASYNLIIKQAYDRKNDEEKKEQTWIELLIYLVGEIIINGKKYFGVAEKPNYAASNILKISDIIIQNYPDHCLTLPEKLKNCFPYIKSVIGFSDNWKTLTNDLDVINNTIKNEPHESPLKKDIIPVIVKFMEDKYKFRYPNLICLYILDDYLSPEFVTLIILGKYNLKENPNFGLNYVNAINSVMVKPFYTSSTVLKEADYDEDKEDVDDSKEPKNEETEKKIIKIGSILLKRLIPLEEYLKQVKEFKKNANSFVPESNKIQDTLRLENNLIYQICALNVDEFFNNGMNDVFITLRDLIRKEIIFIEGFKRLKANENNPKYKEISQASNKRLHLQLGTLRKLEDQAIDKYNKLKDDKYLTLLKDISSLNSEIINKSTDTPNLILHLVQLRKNIPFVRDHEKELSNDPVKITSELYIIVLLALLRKSLNKEDLCDSIIKTLIALANKKPVICNALVKAGCPRLLLQIMENAQSKNLVIDCMELLKMITLSSKENAEVIGGQNILMNLLQIRAKFASVDQITKPADEIANELMKLPGQEPIAEGVIRDAIKEFHQNVQKNFNDNEVKQKILGNEEVINSFTTNKKTVKPILEYPFISDLNKAVDMTTKDQDVSDTIDKLLTNDMGMLKKIKDNLEKKEDPRHDDVVTDVLKILLDKSNFEEPLLLACKCLHDYVKDKDLFDKHVKDKLGEDFVDKLLDIQENYLDNEEVTKEINNILCYLYMRNPKSTDSAIKKGITDVMDELKSVANLNDPSSQALKLNNLKMLNSLLNDPNNLDEFLKNDGVDLINKIIKNDIDNAKNEKKVPEDDAPYMKYFTKGTINTKTPEQFKEDEKLGINSFENLGLTKEEGDKKRNELLKEKENPLDEEEKDPEDSDNYLVQCLQIINKGLDKGKNDFVDDKTVKNLTDLASINFPDKDLFKEVANILSNKDVKLNPESIDDLKDLMKLGLSNKAQYYRDPTVAEKVKAIEDKIADMLMNNKSYKDGFKNAIKKKGILRNKPKPKEESKGKESKPRQSVMDKIMGALGDSKKPEEQKQMEGDEELPEKNKLLTYLALATEPEAFKKVFDEIKPEIGKFFNNMVETYKPIIEKIVDDKENKIKDLALKTAKNAVNPSNKPPEEEKDNGTVEPFNLNKLNNGEKYDEGVVIALAKLYNYLLNQGALFKEENKPEEGDKKEKPASRKTKTKAKDDKKKEKEKGADKEPEKEPALQYIKIKNDKLEKAEDPKENKKISELFDDRDLKNDLEDKDEKDGYIKYYFRKVLEDKLDKPDKNKLDKESGDTPMDEVYGKLKSKYKDFTSPEEGVQLVKTVGHINPDEIEKHMNEVKTLYNKKDDEGNSSGTTVQCAKITKTNKEGQKEPVQYIKATRGGKTKPGEDPISYYKFKDGVDIRDVLDQIQTNGKPDGKDGVDYIKVKGDELPEVQKLFGNTENIPKTYYYTTKAKGDGKDKTGKPYEDGRVHSVTILSDHNNETNKENRVKDVFRKAEEANAKRDKAQAKPKEEPKYYYTKALGSKANKPEDVKLTEIPKNSDLKDLYKKLKPIGATKQDKKDEDDGVLVLKVTGNPNLNDILDQIKSNSLAKFKPEEEKALEEAKKRLKAVPKSASKAKPIEPKIQLKPVPKKPGTEGEPDENCPIYDYNKALGKNKEGDYTIGGIKILGDEFNKYDKPENNYKIKNMIASSEIDPDDDKVKDKTPEYYYTKILGDKLNNLKEDDLDLIKLDGDGKMNDVHKDVLDKLKNRPTKPGKDNKDGVELVKTLGKPDKKDIVKFILDNCKKDLPLNIQYMKMLGSQWSKPKDSINYIKVSGERLTKPDEKPSNDGEEPALYFKVPDDKDLNEALDQIKASSDLLNAPEPEDKFKKVTGDELRDVKKYFDDKDKGIIKPSGSLALEEEPQEEQPKEEEKDKKDKNIGDADDKCVTTKVMGDGLERIDTGDDKLEIIKIKGDKLSNYDKPENNENLVRLKNLFKEANDDKCGVTYYCRKVKGLGIDKPDSLQLLNTFKDEPVETLYEKIKSTLGGLNTPEEGIQLVKVVGNINPNEINKHMNDAKSLYEKKDDEGNSSGTTVQCVKITKKNKDGTKEPVQYIKAIRGEAKDGEDPIAFYKIKDGVDIRDVLDQIQTKGKPDGTDGVDYIKVKGDELPEVQKLFGNNENVPKTYYYTTVAKAEGVDKNGKPYEDGKIHSVTVLSDHDNKTNKKHRVEDVFRKAEEANAKREQEKDNSKYYYTKTLGDLLKRDELQSSDINNVPGDIEMKKIYNKVKGDMINNPEDDDNDLFVIKVDPDVVFQDVIKKIKKQKLALKKKPKGKPGENEEEPTSLEYVKVKGDSANKPDAEDEQYIKISGGLLNKPTKGKEPEQIFKVKGDGNIDEILDKIKNLGSEWNKPENDEKNKDKYEKVSGDQLNNVKNYFKDKDIKDEKGPEEYFYQNKILGDSASKSEQPGKKQCKIKSFTIKSDPNNDLNKGKNIGDLFKDKMKTSETPVYYYTKVLSAGKNKPEEMQIMPINADTNMDNIYDQIQKSGGISKNPEDDEGVQLIKTYGKVEPSDIGKHILLSDNSLPKKANKDPESFYYQNKIIGDSSEKPEEAQVKGRIDSVTIKRDPENSVHKGKNLDTIFKEGTDEEEVEEVKKLGEPVYYFTKIKGGEATKPDQVQLYKASGDTKVDDIYNEIKKLGDVAKHDGIQLYRALGDVDNNDLFTHIKDAGELYNNPEDDKKTEEPTTSYYTTKSLADSVNVPSKDKGLIESITIKRDPDNTLNKNKTVNDVFKAEDDDGEGTPKYIACKVLGDSSFRNPDLSNVQILNVDERNSVDDIINYIKNNMGMSDKPGEKDGVQIFKIVGDVDNNEILDHLKNSRENSPKDAEKDEPILYFYETKTLGDEANKEGDKNVKGTVKSITIKKDPNNDLNKNKNVQDLFNDADKTDEKDSTPAYYYYTKIIGDGKVKPENLEIQQIKGDTNVDDIYNQLKAKGDLMTKPEDNDGIQLFKVTGDVDNNDIINHMKNAGEQRNKPENNGKLKTGGTGVKQPKYKDKILDSGEYKIYGDNLDKDGTSKPKEIKSKAKAITKPGETKSKEKTVEKPTVDEYGTIKMGNDSLFRTPKGAQGKLRGKKKSEPGVQKVNANDDDLECIKVTGDQLENYSKPENKELNTVKSLFKDLDDEDSGVKYYYRKVKGLGIDKPNSIQLLRVEAEKDMDELYKQLKSIGDGLTKPDEGVQLVKTVGNVNPEEINKHMDDAKNLYEKKDDEGQSSGTTVQVVKMQKTNKDGKKEPVNYIKAVRGELKQGEEPVSFYKIKDGVDIRDILEQIQSKGKPDGEDGVDYNKIKGDELPEVQKLFGNNENIPKTYYYSTAAKGDGEDKTGKPYEDGKVYSVTILSDHDNKTNKNNQVKDVFRKAEEANEKKDKNKPKYYYTKMLNSGINKDKLKDPTISNVPGETPMKDIYNSLKTDSTTKPEEEDEGVLLIKAKSDKSDKDIINKIKNSHVNINKPEEEIVEIPESGAPKEDGKPTLRSKKILKPKIQKVDTGDDRLQCVKITGDELNKLAEPENKDKINKVKNIIKDADEEDAGTNYYYRKVFGDGLDRPDKSQLIPVEPNKNMDEIYDQIKALSGGINKPDEGVQLIKVVGDVDPKEINNHLKENQKLNEQPKTDKLPKIYDHETKALGGNLKKNGEPYEDGKIKSITILSDPDNKTNKNVPIKNIFFKIDEEKDKNKNDKDNSVYYYTKNLGDLLNKDSNKANQVNKIDGDADIKEVYNKLKGDMKDKPEDEKNNVFLIKVPSEKNVDDVLKNIKTLGKKILKPEKKSKPIEDEQKLKTIGDAEMKTKTIEDDVMKPKAIIDGSEKESKDEVLDELEGTEGEEPGIGKIDIGDDDLELVKLSGDELVKYGTEPDNGLNVIVCLRKLFKAADEEDSGIDYLYRKVLLSGVDKPLQDLLIKVPKETPMEDVYAQIKEKEGNFTSPEEGVQLVKTVGYLNPDEINKHMNDAKKLYEKKDDEGNSSGTTVQCVKITKKNKDGTKEPVQYIKAKRAEVKNGEEPVSYYKIKDGVDIRDVLDQIQTKGKPDGTDGVDYNKIKGDELPEVVKLFSGSENMPKTYYYTSIAKGDGKDKDGKPYQEGKVHSVTILSDHDNKTNKNYQVIQVFRKAEDANDKKEKDKDKAKYYFIKINGARPDKDAKEPQINKATGDTDIKEIYNKLKGDMVYKPGKGNENDGVLLIKTKPDKNEKDILDKIKSSGASINKPPKLKSMAKGRKPEQKSKDLVKEKEVPEDVVYGVIKMKGDKLIKPEDKKEDIKDKKEEKPEEEEVDELSIGNKNLPVNLKDGLILPQDPKNEELVNNIEIMADPIYKPDNYLFVNEFEKQMDKIMDKLGKVEKEKDPEKPDDKMEVSDYYLSHLNSLYNKAVPFLDDLHKEMQNAPEGQIPELKKEKEDNLDKVLDAVDSYYNTDEDHEIKNSQNKNICDSLINLIDDLSKPGLLDVKKKDEEKPKEIKLPGKLDPSRIPQVKKDENNAKKGKQRLKKLWNLVDQTIKNDDNNQILDPSNSHKVRDIIKKLNNTINKPEFQWPKLRAIPKNISKKLQNEDKVGQDILDLVVDDIKKNGDKDPEVKDMNYETLANLSKFPGYMKQIIKNPELWDKLKKDYEDPNIPNKKRANLSNIFKNALKSNYDVESLINDDPKGIKALLDKIVKEPLKEINDEDEDAKKVAENEVDCLCNLLKDDNNLKALQKGDILTQEHINKLDSLYKDIDQDIIEPLLPMLSKVKEADRAPKQKEKDDDEDKIKELEERVNKCFENHRKALINFAKLSKDPKKQDNQANEDAYSQYLNNLASINDTPENKPSEVSDKPLLRKKSSLRNNELLKNTSSLLKKKLSFVSGTLLFNQDNNAKIKSSLSSIENPEMSEDLATILALLRKNYNDLKNSDDINMNINRMDNIQKCLSLLKKLSLAPDNHKPILEGGFINFMEKLDKDYKLFNEDGTPNVNNRNLGFDVSGKNTLQACSNSENAAPIISESPLFDSIIAEVLKLYEEPGLIASNGDVQKIFLYDNVIFSNLCKNKDAFDKIFNKIGLDKLLNLGKKTGNVNLLDAILNMIKNYIKNTPNKEDIKPEMIDIIFLILEKCINLRDRNAPLMSKVLDIGTNLYGTESLKPKVEDLKLIKSISNDINKFKNNKQYLNSAINCINALSKDNPFNCQEVINCGLFEILNNEVSKVLKDGPENYDQNKDKPNEEADPNGYLKTCFNLSKLYNSLLKNDMDNIDKFNKMGVTENAVKILDTFNDKIEPLTEEEKIAEDNKKGKVLRSGKKPEPEIEKEKKLEKIPIQCIKVNGKELEHLADLDNNLPEQYTVAGLLKPPEKEEDLPNPEYYYMKLLEENKNKPIKGVEKIDTGDDDILVIKISKDQLANYSNEESPEKQNKVRHLFKEAVEIRNGLEYYYRKVLDKENDKPETAKLTKIPLDTDMDELIKTIKEKEGDFKSPEEGVQLVKAIGYIDPKELNKHIIDVKKLYTKKDKEGHSSGTSVQCVKVNRTNKEGKKELMQFIKAVRGEPKKGEEAISYYKVPSNVDLRQVLEDIQLKGNPQGKDGVDFIIIKEGDDLADVQKLFKGTENDPKTYYYTSNVIGDGKPYGNGKINSVTVLSDPNNRINKNSIVKQVFRKAEEQNEKNIKDYDTYYYTKAVGDRIKNDLQSINTNRDTNLKDIYNSVKGDMSDNPNDEQYIFLIKLKGDKKVDDAFNRIKASGAMISKYEKADDIDMNLNKIKGNTKMKDIFIEVQKPNGALLIKAAQGTDPDDIITQVKNSEILSEKPEDEEPDKEKEKLRSGKPEKEKGEKPEPIKEKKVETVPEDVKLPNKLVKRKSTLGIVIDKPQKLQLKGKGELEYLPLKKDLLKICDNIDKFNFIFNIQKKQAPVEEKPVYYYRKISVPPSDSDNELKNVKENTVLDDLHKQLKTSGIILEKPGEGLQIFKVIGSVDDNDYIKHIQESELLYKKPGSEESAQIQIRSIKLYPHGKEAGDKDMIMYIFVTGGFKPDVYYKTQGETDLNLVLEQIKEKGVPEKDGKPFDVVSGDELEKVKTYFKPKEAEGKKPKEKGVDLSTPKVFFYTTKGSDGESVIQSITLLSDPTNSLNKGQIIEKLFKDEIAPNAKTTYCYTKYIPSKEDDDTMQIQQIDGNTKVNEIKLEQPGDSIQIVKYLGPATPDDMANHLRTARKNSKNANKDEKVPTFYYKTKLFGGEEGQEGEPESETTGRVDSVTIKRDSENNLHKGKNLEIIFKEGEEEEDAEKVKKLGNIIYYYIRIKGGIIPKPEEVKLIKGTPETKIDDIYAEVKKSGPLEKNDGVQLLRASGKIDNENILSHVKEALEIFNNPEEDKKSEEPTTSFYSTEVLSEIPKDKGKGGKDQIIIYSITFLTGESIKYITLTIIELFQKEIEVDVIKKERQIIEEEDGDTPVLYYTKILEGKPGEIALIRVEDSTKMEDLVKSGDEGTIIIKAPKNANIQELLDTIKKSGITSTMYKTLVQEPKEEVKIVQQPVEAKEKEKEPEDELKERKRVIQYTKVAPTQLKDLNDPDLEQRYTVDDIIGPLDEGEEGVEDPNPIYYYTTLFPESQAKLAEKPELNLIGPTLDMGEVYQRINKNDEGYGALLIKAPHNSKLSQLIEPIKQDGLNIRKGEEEEGDEITTAIYYITELVKTKPKEYEKLLGGNIPLKLLMFAKSKEDKNGEEEPITTKEKIVPEVSEAADDKMPKEMVRDIMRYSIGTLNRITVAPDSNEFLAKKTSFGDTIIKSLENDNNDIEFLLTALQSFGNYLSNENGQNYSKLDVPKTYELLHGLQAKHYSNPEVLTQINYISGSLVKNLKDDNKGKEYSKKFYELVPESTKCQDQNADLVLISLKIMNDGLEKKPFLVEQVYDETAPSTLSLLKLYKDNAEIQENGYRILSLFAKNKVFSTMMINNGILSTIKETLENASYSFDLKEKNKSIRNEIFKLLTNLCQDEENSVKIADELIGQLIQDLNEKGYSEETNAREIIKLLDTLLNNNQCAAPFVQFGGLDVFINLLEKNESNVQLAISIFQILKKVTDANNEYRRMLQQRKMPDLINKIIKKSGVYDKKVEYEGRQLLFNINLCKAEVEDPNKVSIEDITITEPVPVNVKNFLTKGQQVKVITPDGDVNSMQLMFSPDLMTVFYKKPKTDKPKPEDIIETSTIKKVLKGHGTDAFQKSKGFFRSIPNPELCFSIIGPTTVDGVKTFNIECENEKDADKWVENLQVVVNYFKKTHISK